MATTVMNSDECDIAHEVRMLEEYGEEVKYAERNPQLVPAGKSPVGRATNTCMGIDTSRFPTLPGILLRQK